MGNFTCFGCLQAIPCDCGSTAIPIETEWLNEPPSVYVGVETPEEITARVRQYFGSFSSRDSRDLSPPTPSPEEIKKAEQDRIWNLVMDVGRSG